MHKKSPSNSRNVISSFPDLSRQICSDLSERVRHSDDIDDFRLSYLCDVFLSKHPSLEGGVSSEAREKLAFEKMLASEKRNSATNCRLLPSDGILPSDVSAVFHYARRIMAGILGPLTADVVVNATFSNGASTSKKRHQGDAFFKIVGKSDVTQDAYGFAVAAVKAYPLYEEFLTEQYGSSDNWFNVVQGNEAFTVPKNSSIDRAACKEPDLNMFLQSGVGSHIRRRLRRHGIDLNDQTQNQRLAREGSIDGRLATIDLSSASDSVTRALVMTLVPYQWYSYLDAIRSKTGLICGKRHRWEMFSSMGNGFTFELESAIFYSLARACLIHLGIDDVVGVYGDDIILPCTAYNLLETILSFAGFTVNSKKSFARGFFRESCGKHFYEGVDVTPFFVKKPITDTTRIIWFLNQLRSWCSVNGFCDSRFYPIWKKYSKLVPKTLHGGKDLQSIFALVTPGQPNRVLRPLNKGTKISGKAALIRYGLAPVLNASTKFDEERLKRTIECRYRLVPNNAWWTPIPEFQEEL
ncbi:MAG: replicase [Leviviridae sp.]|nr:MAG: replicase [Leviviridae sp.]